MTSATRARPSLALPDAPGVRGWMLLCAGAETIGMTAAAAAARGTAALLDAVLGRFAPLLHRLPEG